MWVSTVPHLCRGIHSPGRSMHWRLRSHRRGACGPGLWWRCFGSKDLHIGVVGGTLRDSQVRAAGGVVLCCVVLCCVVSCCVVLCCVVLCCVVLCCVVLCCVVLCCVVLCCVVLCCAVLCCVVLCCVVLCCVVLCCVVLCCVVLCLTMRVCRDQLI